MTEKLGVSALETASQNHAVLLARHLRLPIVAIDDVKEGLLLVVSQQRVELQAFGKNAPGSLYVDFLRGINAYRRYHGGGRGQLIARAVGLKQGYFPRILDATAGLGRDAFALACLGCDVTMIERSPIIAALIEDGLMRAKADDSCRDLGLNLIVGDSVEIMQRLKMPDYPDVIYLDPLFPPRNKSALVKKEMRYLQAVLGEDRDACDLLPIALKRAKRRVVVKRAKLAPPLCGQAPDFIIKGQSTRFDVYATAAGSE